MTTNDGDRGDSPAAVGHSQADATERAPQVSLYAGFGIGTGIVVAGIAYGWRTSTRAAQQPDALTAMMAAKRGKPAPAAAASAAVPPIQQQAQQQSMSAEQAFESKLHPAMRRLPSGQTAGGLAVRAFLYGSLLSVAGCACLFYGIAWYFDASSASEFGSKMRVLIPQQREAIRSVIVPFIEKFVYRRKASTPTSPPQPPPAEPQQQEEPQSKPLEEDSA